LSSSPLFFRMRHLSCFFDLLLTWVCLGLLMRVVFQRLACFLLKGTGALHSPVLLSRAFAGKALSPRKVSSRTESIPISMAPILPRPPYQTSILTIFSPPSFLKSPFLLFPFSASLTFPRSERPWYSAPFDQRLSFLPSSVFFKLVLEPLQGPDRISFT